MEGELKHTFNCCCFPAAKQFQSSRLEGIEETMLTKLRFKTIHWYEEAIPNGYRLATVEEVRNNFDTIKGRVLLEKYNRGACLLDGHISPNYRLDHGFEIFEQWVVVKEKEFDENAGVWKKKCSACYPLNGNMLRKQLYDGIILSQQGRHTAMALASFHLDPEVLYWLLKTTNQIELQGVIDFMKSWKATIYGPVNDDLWKKVLENLSDSEFPLQLPFESDHFMKHFGNSSMDIDLIYSFISYGDETRGIAHIDFFIEMYSTNIVHYEAGDGMSILDRVTRIAINDEDWIPALTKLLSVSQHSLENEISEIKHHFGDILIEAIERGYAQLVEDLLELKDYVEQLTTKVCLQGATGAVRKFGNLLEKNVGNELQQDKYVQCLSDLLNLLKQKVGNELQQDKDGKTLFHYAADSGNEKVFQKLIEAYNDEYTEKKRDKWGRNFLHWAALNGQVDYCEHCVKERQLKVDYKDSFGRNSLHLAAQGKKGHLVLDFLVRSSSENLIYAKDDEGKTPLHFASAKGNIKMVEKILSFGADNPSQQKYYIQQVDGFRKSALQMAAGGGHTRIVRLFLDKGCDPLSQRDINGSTALHYATQVKDREVAVAISQSLLKKYEDDREKKSCLLWASAAGIGTAEEREKVDPFVEDFLVREKARDKINLLQAAARNNNPEMAWELLNRGARMTDLDRYNTTNEHDYKMNWELRKTNPDKYRNKEDRNEEDRNEAIKNVKSVIREIEIAKEHGRDKPSLMDNLERNVLAEGLGALFLNRFIESPITVGISGEWGMGKSSLMIQTENILLMAASQLSFPNLLRSEKFVGAEKISLSTKGRKIYRRMKNAISKLLAFNTEYSYSHRKSLYDLLKIKTKGDISWWAWSFFLIAVGIAYLLDKFFPETKGGLVKFLEEYHPQHHAIYKSLACMDIHNQMLRSDVKNESQFQQMRGVPRILTIRYNAWHYHDANEAWAGLAVTITKEIEKAMTRAQRFSTCWRYSWAKNSVNICIQIFLPCLLATFLAGWVAWAAWALLRDAKFKDLQYGSIPCTIVVIVWVILKSVISVVKPVSTQMMGYINSPDHTARLGYQEQVISDINFLKEELGRKPHWFFSFISGEWCRNWFGLYPDNVENTSVPKFRPASEDQLRMITFVDDLDRCDEKVVLQVLSAINLVLAECKINVILGIDKKMIQRAVEKHFKDSDDKDLADKFICKIIQIPLSLPDPTDEESDKFLQHYLGHKPPIKNTLAVEHNEDTDYGDIDTDNDDICIANDDEEVFNTNRREEDDEEVFNTNRREEKTVADIDCSNGLHTSCQGIIKKVYHWSTCFFQLFFRLSCTLSHELQQTGDGLNTKGIHSLTFSKGARLTREMLLSNYTPEEATTLYKLKGFTIGSQKLPREWKRFLDYRKFICNVLSVRGKVYRLPNWKLELLAWIFICWNWKHEMNTLIKDWHKYACEKVKDEEKHMEDEDEVEAKQHWYGPSLKQIVMNYIIALEEGQQNSNIEAEESQTQYFKWLNLLEAMDVQDVSMRGIQLFQQFRLHCETDHLVWPLPESNIDKYRRLRSSIHHQRKI